MTVFLYFSGLSIASVRFSNPILGDTTPNSVQNQIPSARHTPVQSEIPFITPSSHPQQPQLSQQPIQVNRHPETTPYDMETWFNTFPSAGNPTPTPSTDFTQFQRVQVIFFFIGGIL